MESPNRRQLENIWRERTEVAAEDYRNAKDITAMVQLERADGMLPAADGDHAYMQALRGECEALWRYKQTLKLFTGLVLRCEVPPVDDGEPLVDHTGEPLLQNRRNRSTI